MSARVLFTTQRNEGPFLLEWIAYHHVIGFNRFVVLSNDCTDGSDDLLDALSEVMPLHHRRQIVPTGANAQHQGQALARAQGLFDEGDWVAWLDADEFLNSHVGSWQVSELIEAAGAASAIVMNWRLFGSGGRRDWPGLQLDPVFGRCSTRWHKSARYCKTLFRHDPTIDEMVVHRPIVAAPATDAPLWLDSDGASLPQTFVTGTRANGAPFFQTPKRPNYSWVQVNHYMVRTRRLYTLRQTRGRGDLTGDLSGKPKRRYTWAHYMKHNCNLLRDRSIQRHLPALRAEIDRLLGHPAIARAQAATLAASGLT